MPANDYSPEQALRVLMRKLSGSSTELADTVQAAVDAGKDVQAAEPDGKGKSGTREYRKTVPYTYEEAIAVALTALEAYFVVNALMRNSCADNFIQSAVGPPRLSLVKLEKGRQFGFDKESVGTEKTLQIELRTETQLIPENQALQISQEVYSLGRVSASDIHAEQENLARLRDLVKFD